MSLLDLAAKLTLDSSEYEKGLDNAEGRASKVGGALKKGLGTVAKVGTAAVGAAAAGIVAFSKQSVEAASGFETSFAQLQTIMDETQKSSSDMQSGLMELSSKMGVSASELAETTYNAISATGDTAGALDIVENASKLATAGFTDTGSALSTLTTVMNSYKMTAEETAGISDSLITVQNLGVTTVSELSATMGKAIASASAYGVDLYNLESAYVSMTKSGINTAESTTYISSMLKELGSDSSDVAKTLQEKTGKSFSELMSEGKTLGDVLGVLNDSVDGDANALMNLWSSAEAGKASNAIISQGLEEFNGNLDTIKDSAGLTEDAYATMADTLSHKTDLLKTGFENLQITFGQNLIPGVGDIVDTLTGGIGEVTEAVSAGDWDAAFGAIGTMLGDVASTIMEYVPELISGAVTLVQSLANALISNAPMIMNAAFEIVNMLVSSLSDTSKISEVISFGTQLLTTLANGITQALPTLMAVAVDVITQLVLSLTDPSTIGTVTTAAVNILTALGEGLTSSIDSIISVVPQILENLMTALVENAPVLLGAGLSLITSLADSLMDALPVLIQAVPVLIEGLVNFIVNSAPLILTAGVQLIVQLAQGLITAIPSLVSAVPLIISSLFQGIVQMLPIILSAGIQLMQQLTYGILQTIPSLISQIPMIIQSFVAGFTGNFGTILQTGVQLLVELGRGIIQGAALFVTQIPELVIQIAKSFIGGIPDMLNAGKELATGLWDGIKGMFSGKKDISVTDKVDFSGINEKSQSALDAFTDISTSATDTAGYVTTAFSDIGESLELPNIGTDSTFSALTTSADTTATGISTTFSTLGTDISTNISTGISTVDWSPISSGAQTAADEAVSAMSDMPDKVNENWEDIQKDYKEVPEWFQKTFDSAKQNVLSAWQVLPDEFKAVWEQIKNVYKEAPTWFQTTFNEVRDNIAEIMDGIADDAYTWGSDMMENFNNGVNGQQQATEDAVRNQGRTIANNLEFSEPKEGPLSNFHTYAPDMMDLFISGIKSKTPELRRTVRRSFDLREEMTPTMTVSTARTARDTSTDAVLALLRQYLPELANRNIVLDSGETVGALLPQIDSGLGATYNYKARGNA